MTFLRRRWMGALLWLFAVGLAMASPAGGLAAAEPGAAPPTVAAAASLRFGLAEVRDAFAKDTGHAVRISFGSSGNLARQIMQGAPYALFMSADEDYVLDLARKGLTVDEGVVYATGHIVVFAPKASKLSVDGGLEGLRRMLENGRLGRFAIANPDHAPYGRAAREVLIRAGLWDRIQPHLIFGENISQTAQFAASGSAAGGLLAQSLVLAPAFAGQGRWAPVPETWHRPLHQRMALVRGAPATAKRFFEYLQQPPARAILARYGFSVPDRE